LVIYLKDLILIIKFISLNQILIEKDTLESYQSYIINVLHSKSNYLMIHIISKFNKFIIYFFDIFTIYLLCYNLNYFNLFDFIIEKIKLFIQIIY